MIATVVAKAMGNADVEITTPDSARTEFLKWLTSEPPKDDLRRKTLLAALFPDGSI